MQVLVHYTYDSDLIECPDDIVEKLVYYQTEYDKWAVEHDCIVDLETFIEWVNQKYLKDNVKKICIINTGIHPTEEQKKLPKLYY